MTIKQKLTNNCNVKTSRDIKYIVIHYCGAEGSAENNAIYFAREKLSASAHYFVGYAKENAVIYQSVLDKDVAWHCGAGSGSYFHPECRNANSIGIELCCYKNKDGTWRFDDLTVATAVELTKSLMKKYNIPVGNVVRHYDVTHKVCPEPYVRDVKAWEAFKNRLKEEEEMLSYEQFKEYSKKYEEEKREEAPEDWSDDMRKWAVDKGLVKGDKEDRRAWMRTMTMQELITVLYRMHADDGK